MIYWRRRCQGAQVRKRRNETEKEENPREERLMSSYHCGQKRFNPTGLSQKQCRIHLRIFQPRNDEVGMFNDRLPHLVIWESPLEEFHPQHFSSVLCRGWASAFHLGKALRWGRPSDREAERHSAWVRSCQHEGSCSPPTVNSGVSWGNSRQSNNSVYGTGPQHPQGFLPAPLEAQTW